MSEEPKSNYKLPLIIALAICVGLLVGNKLAIPTLSTQSNSTDVQKLNDILNLLDDRYVDKINKDSIYEETISEMLHKLDPHSNYMTAKDMKEVNEGIDGKFGGIGVRFLVLRDTICVSHVIEGSPSYFAGVKAGDKIIEINGKSLKKKIATDDVMSKLKGNPGTEVQIKVLRNNVKKSISITRDLIPIRSVTCAYMIDRNTGYILIDQFSVPTAEEFHQEAKRLKSLGMTKLVLDLRNNPGGVLTSATEIADEFLPGGLVIVKTKGRRTGEQVYKSKSGDLLEKTKVVVLINSNSASASEILAGALQDNDRGTIVGRRSFGKGLVQEDRALRDGSNLRITIARYYTPSGRCIQRPYSGNYEDYIKDEERFLNGELYQADKQKLPDSLKFKTRKGRIVYGGGGIYPDVFVPLDSTGGSFYLTELQFSGAFNAFAFDYVKDKRTKWISADQFAKTFVVDDAILKSFCAFSSKNFKVSYVDGEFKKSKELISKFLKAEIGRQIWTEEGFYRVINLEDNEFKEAIENFE